MYHHANYCPAATQAPQLLPQCGESPLPPLSVSNATALISPTTSVQLLRILISRQTSVTPMLANHVAKYAHCPNISFPLITPPFTSSLPQVQ